MVLGVMLYVVLRAKPERPQPVMTSNPTVSSAQRNYFILRVDDLGKSSPSVISVWVALVFPADYSTLIFKSLYPPIVSNTEAYQAYPLRLAANGYPTSEFWNYFNQLPLKRDGFVLFDNYGLSSVSRFITGEEITLVPIPDDPNLRVEAILTEEHLLWQQTCLGIQSKKDHRGPEIIWSDLIPDHFRTDIGFSDLMYLWDKFSTQGDPLHCEILITP